MTYTGVERQRTSPAPGTRAIFSPGSWLTSVRQSASEKIAPMEARTAFGLYGSAVPGPSATHDAPNAAAERSTVPTLPGSCKPCRYTHSGPTAAGAHRSSYTASVRVPDPRPDADASTSASTETPGRPLPTAA